MSRYVVLAGPWAFKMPRLHRYGGDLGGRGRWRLFVTGILHNLHEFRDGHRPKDRPLARTCWTLAGLMNCQERAEPLSGPLPPELEDWLGERDLKLRNLGVVRGRLVLVDYA